MDLVKKPTESIDEYKNRIYIYKLTNPEITWKDVAKLMSSELGESGTANKYRKEFKRKFDVSSSSISEEDVSMMESLQNKLVEIRKESRVLSDLRNDVNAQLRAIDRYEDLERIAKECAQEISQSLDDYKFKDIKIDSTLDERRGLLLLSDWHFGPEVDTFWNKFNPDICKQRLQNLLDRVIPVIKENNIHYVTVFNLGDLIGGRIHAQIRMQSRIDAVKQTLEVAELLHQFIVKLRRYCIVDYYDCLDNHSRVEPNKKESLQLESFAEVIHWHLDWMFREVPGVCIHKNKYGDSLIYAEILGHKILGVHGDKDKPSTVVQKRGALVGFRPDLVCTAHRHHFSADETNRCPVLCNPSLMGQDDYALDGSLDSSPAQLFVIITKDNPMYAVYRIIAE